MGRGSRFLESSATEEEDSYEYRVEWDVFNDYRDDSDYIGVRLIKIDSNGSESIYAS